MRVGTSADMGDFVKVLTLRDMELGQTGYLKAHPWDPCQCQFNFTSEILRSANFQLNGELYSDMNSVTRITGLYYSNDMVSLSCL